MSTSNKISSYFYKSKKNESFIEAAATKSSNLGNMSKFCFVANALDNAGARQVVLADHGMLSTAL
jgi:hypothetical protein